MTITPNLQMPLIMAGQAQKHLTHNEALRSLDAIVQLSVRDRDLEEPPANPEIGARYIVPPGTATGAWSGHGGRIAAWQDGAWNFYQPQTGWIAHVADEALWLGWDGAAWVVVNRSETSPLFGVNTAADAVNKLAVRSAGSLFDHEGGSHRMTLNKAAVPDTAAMVFQTGFSGRAEIGTTGSDDLSLKLSGDGINWKRAMVADGTSGRVRFPGGLEHEPSRKPLQNLLFTPGGDGQVSIYRNDRARGPTPRQAVLAGRAGDTLTLAAADAALFFHAFMTGVSRARIWNMTRSPAEPAWVRGIPSAGSLQVSDAAHIAAWGTGDVIQLGDFAPHVATSGFALDIAPLLQTVLGSVFPQSGLILKAGIAATGAANISVSPTTVSGSFTAAHTPTDGSYNAETIILPCTMLSPISNSHLLFVRESVTGGTLGTTLLSAVGVFA